MNYRRRALMWMKRSRLPVQYQEVEYLESTGEQYIDTGYKCNQNTKVQLGIRLIMLDNQIRLSGARTSSRSNAFMISKNRGATGLFAAQFDNVSHTEVTGVLGDLSLFYTLELSKEGYYINNILSRTFLNPTSFTTPVNLLLFGLNDNGAIQIASSFKFYSCKIYDNNIQVRNFIPCYRKSDNKPGLYDTINSVFYSNANTGASEDFIVGSDVN